MYSLIRSIGGESFGVTLDKNLLRDIGIVDEDQDELTDDVLARQRYDPDDHAIVLELPPQADVVERDQEGERISVR